MVEESSGLVVKSGGPRARTDGIQEEMAGRVLQDLVDRDN